MKLSDYDNRHIRVTDKGGRSFEGLAEVFPAGYGLHEFDREEESIRIADCRIFAGDIAEIGPVPVHGTAELATQRLLLRRYRPDDAESLYIKFGCDEVMYRYSGWNPYATSEAARKAVDGFIRNYEEPYFYGWVIEYEGILAGIIGAYDYKDDSIEVGFSIARDFWGHGFAAEALETVLDYLIRNEGISCVTAWCAAENIASGRTLEKAGMMLVREEKDALAVMDKTYDRLYFEKRAGKRGGASFSGCPALHHHPLSDAD